MELHYIDELYNEITVARDGTFNGLGLTIHYDTDQMLTYITDERYLNEALLHENIASVITSAELAEKVLGETTWGVAVCEKPDIAFFSIHNHLVTDTDFYMREEYQTEIGSNCTIAESAIIAEKNVRIGNNTIIENGVVIEEHVSIGDGCYIGQNTVIGSRGFQYYRDGGEGIYVRHIGGVIIESNVDILACCCVAGGLFLPTIIRSQAKLDNLIHVAHSVYIDEGATLPAGVILGGNSRIGKNAWVGINSTIRQMAVIGDGATVCMGAVVTQDVETGCKVSGNFAIEHDKTIKNLKRLRE